MTHPQQKKKPSSTPVELSKEDRELMKEFRLNPTLLKQLHHIQDKVQDCTWTGGHGLWKGSAPTRVIDALLSIGGFVSFYLGKDRNQRFDFWVITTTEAIAITAPHKGIRLGLPGDVFDSRSYIPGNCKPEKTGPGYRNPIPRGSGAWVLQWSGLMASGREDVEPTIPVGILLPFSEARMAFINRTTEKKKKHENKQQSNAHTQKRGGVGKKIRAPR